MRLERSIAAAALSLGLMLGGAARAATPGSKAATAEQLAANAEKLAKPGPEHKVLESFLGHWTSKVSMQPDPSKPAQESVGSADGKMVLGGRFVQVNHKGTMMGQPFEGMMLAGFDNVPKRYESDWVDTMGTGIIHYMGTYDAGKKQLNMSAHFVDPATRKLTITRSVTTFVDANTWTYDEYVHDDAAKKEDHVMSVTFKRG